MIKNVAFRLIRHRVKKYLPAVNSRYYNKLFTLSYKLITYLKPSQLWFIIIALINKTDLKTLVSIPSMFILFNTLLSDNHEPNLDSKALLARLELNKFINN